VAAEKVRAAALAKQAAPHAELQAASGDQALLEAASHIAAAAADEAAAKALAEAAKALAEVTPTASAEAESLCRSLLDPASPSFSSSSSSSSSAAGSSSPYGRGGSGPTEDVPTASETPAELGRSVGRPSVFDFFGEGARKNGYSVDAPLEKDLVGYRPFGVGGVGPSGLSAKSLLDYGNEGAAAPGATPSYPAQLSPAYPASGLAAGTRAAVSLLSLPFSW
jgi:hypothetical protein